jgi:hypothetical protein
MSKASSSKHPHLTAEELAEFREIFNLVDLDKGGTISKDELKQLMNTLGLKPSQVRVHASPGPARRSPSEALTALPLRCLSAAAGGAQPDGG